MGINVTPQAVDVSAKANVDSPSFTGTVVLPSTSSIGDVDSTEISRLDGVSANVQTQLDAKATKTLTIEQKNILIGKVWGYEGQLFNPILDANNIWFISNEEVNGCTLQQAQLIGCDGWLLSLPEIDHNPIIADIF